MTRFFANTLCLVAVLGIAACGGLKHIPPSTSITGIDFTPYSSEGFMFTPEMYRGDYESVGVINVVMHAEGNLVVSQQTGIQEWQFGELRIADLVEEAHKRAVAMGANAIVNFNIRAAPKLVGTVSVPGIEVTGFAIKRIGAFR